MTRRVLVAGVGNLFLGDDGFGAEVTRRLRAEALPDGVRARDFGVGAVHLVYELLDGVDELILVDASPRGSQPGSLYLVEPDLEALAGPGTDADPEALLIDAHSLTPDAVLGLVARARASVGRVRVVACEPASVEEGMGLSEPVAAAVGPAVRMLRALVDGEVPTGERVGRAAGQPGGRP